MAGLDSDVRERADDRRLFHPRWRHVARDASFVAHVEHAPDRQFLVASDVDPLRLHGADEAARGASGDGKVCFHLADQLHCFVIVVNHRPSPTHPRPLPGAWPAGGVLAG